VPVGRELGFDEGSAGLGVGWDGEQQATDECRVLHVSSSTIHKLGIVSHQY